jgi:hypothetical protein
MNAPTITCDVCGRPKGPTNNWFKAITPLYPEPIGTGLDGIAFGGSDAKFSDDPMIVVEDICGVDCLHKRLSHWIEAHRALIAVNASATKESETK